MLKPLQFAALTAAGVLAWSLTAKARAGSRLVFFPGGVGPINFDQFTPRLRVVIRVQNTSGQTLRVNSMAGDVLINGTAAGNFSSFERLTFAPNSETALTVWVGLNPVGIVSELINVIFYGGGRSLAVQLDGYVNADGFQVPLNITYKLGA